MDVLILKAVGGVGLFLMGMYILTDGLRKLAGNALRSFLRRSTRSPLSGAASGALTTAILQSSSATTVATVGFVGAGLLTFPQALGIIFGANIGTTVTGWLVAILGFKLQLGLIVTPLVLVGALMNIFAAGRWKHVGWALAGFSLLFIGIDAMQDGMSFLKEVVSPSDFPGNTILGRLQLVLIGIAITIVTQSSSAGVAIALAALSTEAITFPQAAAMVIGMDVGTTFTAALATLGGSTATRRTGYAHVLYNVMTGVMAFILLNPLAALIEIVSARTAVFDPQISLVAFHTIFNLLGVVLVIGFTNSFARLVTRLVPERGPPLTARLDSRLLSDTAAATDALAATINEIAITLFATVHDRLREPDNSQARRSLVETGNALETLRRFAERVNSDPEDKAIHARYTAALHALDHLIRLHNRCLQSERIRSIDSNPDLAQLGENLSDALEALSPGDFAEPDEKAMDALRRHLRKQRYSYRNRAIDHIPAGRGDIDELVARLDGIRWLHRVTYHVWRIVYHQIIATSMTPDHRMELELEPDFPDD
ncbi:MAG: Na/Pi symporter [Pseudomonadota bacterium]